MKDKYLVFSLAAALLLAITGIIVLACVGKPVPDSLNTVAAGAIGALAMAFRGNGGNGGGDATPNADK